MAGPGQIDIIKPKGGGHYVYQSDYVPLYFAICLNTGNYDKVIEITSHAIRLSPDSPNHYYYRGMAYRRKGDVERARSDYATVKRLAPNEEYYYPEVDSLSKHDDTNPQ